MSDINVALRVYSILTDQIDCDQRTRDKVPHVKDTIAARIRQAREQAQMDPQELRAKLKTRKIEISKTGLHRLETLEPKNPNLKLIEAIAEITNVSPGWLLFGKGPPVPSDEVGAAIRGRVLDTIELMSRALDLTDDQQRTLNSWLKSVRATVPRKITRP